MKSFNYTARDGSGALRRGIVEAGNREEALGQLRALNLIPISIADTIQARTGQIGWTFRGTRLRWFFSVIILAVGLFIVIVKFVPSQKREPAGAESTPAVTNRIRSVGTTGRPSAPSMAEKQTPAPVVTGKEIPSPSDVTVVEPINEVAPVPKAVETSITSDLHPEKTDSLPTGLSSGSERVLNTMFTARLGGPPPPLLNFPPNEAANLVDVLSRDIIVFDEDDAATVEKKTTLALVKQTLKEYLQKGGSAEDFMVYYRDLLKQAFTERLEMQQAYIALRNSGDAKATAEYFESANKALLRKGYLPLSAPPTLREQP